MTTHIATSTTRYVAATNDYFTSFASAHPVEAVLQFKAHVETCLQIDPRVQPATAVGMPRAFLIGSIEDKQHDTRFYPYNQPPLLKQIPGLDV